jgi:hypothetical protein
VPDETPDKQKTAAKPSPLMGPPDPLGQWPLMGLPPHDPLLPHLMLSPDDPAEQWDPAELVQLLHEFVDRLMMIVGPFVAAAALWLSYLMLSGRLRIR